MSQPDLTPTGYPPDYEPDDIAILRAVEPYTIAGTERTHALIQAVKYVVRQGVPGALVECGVWKGGSVMAMALTLLREGAAARDLYLFDTFEGMTAPGGRDVDYLGRPAADVLEEVRFAAGQAEVAQAVLSTGYDPAHVCFVPGRVEDTLPGHAPAAIALLRLDTDWYESTRHELVHLFPRLVRGGVLLVDDYGHWQGARHALDEYLAEHGVCLYLHRIDYTGRLGVKI